MYGIVMTAPKTAAQRQAARKARQRAAGFVRWTCWAHPDDRPRLKALADRLEIERRRPKE